MSACANQGILEGRLAFAAERTLRRRGGYILAHNWSCSDGTVGLVVLEGKELVFVNARMSETTSHEEMERPLPDSEMDRMERVARAFAAQAPHTGLDMRLDVVVCAMQGDGLGRVCHHIAARSLPANGRGIEEGGRPAEDPYRGEEGNRGNAESDSHCEPEGRRGQDRHRREPGRGAR